MTLKVFRQWAFPMLIILFTGCQQNTQVSGVLTKWQPVTLTFEGPEMTEESATFRNYRLDVTFRHGDRQIRVPGYFAADGDAANTGASSGSRWRVKFTPDEAGEWSYTVSFRSGKDIAACTHPDSGRGLAFDGVTGRFKVKNTEPDAPGFYGKGILRYADERYLRFDGTGEWFVKAGPGGPENFLGYADFDGTFNVPGGIQDSTLGEDRLHDYEPHLQDWRPGDPTWADGRGKAIVGAVNYLASKGLNTLYMVTNNVNGDGRDCWPWTDYDARDIYDVSKLAQWDILFTHMNAKGIHLDFYLWESENTQLLNGGDLGPERKIYYREMVARFGHLPGIRWNISEEPTITAEQVRADAAFISDLDPYGHAVGVHCGYTVERRDHEYPPLLGFADIDGAWMQCHENHHAETLRWIHKSDSAGHKWVVGVDESLAIRPDDADKARRWFWEVVTAGGEGFDVYFGYGGGVCDIANEDFRNRDVIWDQLAAGLNLFRRPEINAMLPKMENRDDLGEGMILAASGELYIVYLTQQSAQLDLSDAQGEFTVRWFDPVNGGELQTGGASEVSGGTSVNLGDPPVPGDEWVVVVTHLEI